MAWHHDSIRSIAEMGRVMDRVVAAMTAADYPPRDLFGMRLALEEALSNAVRHGNRNDPARRVRVRYRVTARRTLAEIIVANTDVGADEIGANVFRITEAQALDVRPSVGGGGGGGGHRPRR